MNRKVDFRLKSLVCLLLMMVSACHSKPLALNPTLPSSEACETAYTELYRKDVLDFRIVFGYKDARPSRFVGDRYERAAFIQQLLEYGFIRVPGESEKFVYAFLGPGRKPKQIHLQIISSSVGPDDDENRKSTDQFQQSKHAEEVFLTGLQSADLVFYYGHSRDGGGPDFAPPHLSKQAHTDYGWYLKHEPGLRKMIQALKKPGARPKVIGLYSCVSDRLFAEKILAVSPEAALMLSDVLLYYIDALNGMRETLTGLIEMKCQPDFHPTGIHLVNFFKADRKAANVRDLKSLRLNSHH